MTPRHRLFIMIAGIMLLSIPALPQTLGCPYDPQIEALMAQVSADSIDKHVQNLADAGGHESRISYTPGNEWAALYIKQVFDRYPGLTSVTLDTFYASDGIPPYNNEPLVNVVATLEGSNGPDEYYLVGGHLDATANLDPNLSWPADWATAKARGADDNASGVAAILEMARVLSDPANGFSHPYTIKFIAFGAEERHPMYNDNNHWGSRRYAFDAYLAGDQILGVYVLDMIGFNNTGNHHFNIVANDMSQVLGLRMLEVNLSYSVGLHANSMPFPYATYSDHEQFWLYSYKAILIIENAPPWSNSPPWYTANPYYHRESDLPTTVNIPQVTKVAKLALGTIACVAGPTTGIEPGSAAGPPRAFSLMQNYPNPFNAGTQIRYQLLAGGAVSLKVYNTSGQQVATLVNGFQPAGEYQIGWEGLNDRGEGLPSGMYLLSLGWEGERVVRKMMLLK